MFEWMIDCYKDTPKDKLIELAKGHQNFETLKRLNHMELVLEWGSGL